MSGHRLHLDDLSNEELLHVADVLGSLARTSRVHPCLLTALDRTAAAARTQIDARFTQMFHTPEETPVTTDQTADTTTPDDLLLAVAIIKATLDNDQAALQALVLQQPTRALVHALAQTAGVALTELSRWAQDPAASAMGVLDSVRNVALDDMQAARENAPERPTFPGDAA